MTANTAASLGFGLAGAAIGGPAGWAIGAAIGGALFPPQLPNQKEKKLEDPRITRSAYGDVIPIVYGKVRLAATMMWSKGIKAKKHEEDVGGKGGPSYTSTYYTYSLTAAYAICEGPVDDISRIWINGRLMYDKTSAENRLSFNGPNKLATAVNFYKGTEDQEPSSLQEATKGTGKVPAYRGLAYLEFQKLQLEEFGNSLINVEVEVVKSGTPDNPPNSVHQTDVARPETVSDLGTDGAIGAMEEGTVVWNEGVDRLNLADADVTITRTDLYNNVLESNVYPVRMPGPYDATINASFCKNDPYFVWIGHTAEGIGGTDGYLYWFRYFDPINGYVQGSETYPSGQGLGPYGLKDYESYDMSSLHRTIRFGDEYYFTIVSKSGGTEYMLRYLVDTSTLAPTLTNAGGIDFANDTRFTASVTYLGDIWQDAKGTNEYFFVRLAGSPATTNNNEFFLKLDKNMNIINKWSNYANSSSAYTAVAPAHSGTFISSDGYLMRKLDANTQTIQLYEFDADTDDSEFTLIGTVSNSVNTNHSNILPITETWAMGRDDLFTIEELVEASAVAVADIVQDQLLRVALSSAEINVAGLTKEIAGYWINSPQSARDSIETLQPIGFFDVAEVDGQLVCVERGGAAVKTIPQDDLAATTKNDSPDDMEITRTGELELPRAVNVTYVNPDDDYELNTQTAERPTVISKGIQNVKLPIVLDDSNGMEIADTTLFSHYAERESVKFSLSTKHLNIAPNDVILLGDSGFRVRVTDVTQEIVGALSIEGVIELTEATYTSIRGAAFVSTTSVAAGVVGPTIFKLMALPMLRGQDNTSGYYLAAYGTLSAWDGMGLYVSDDNTTYTEVQTQLTAADVGYVSSALVSAASDTTWDWTNTITVVMPTGGILQSDTESNVLDGANAAAVGKVNGTWEIIQWVTASALGSNEYRLSQLLRGRAGTEHATDTHVDFEDFVVLDTTGETLFVSDSLSNIDTTRYFKGVSIGNLVQNTDPTTFTNTGETLKPRSPVLVRPQRDGSNDIQLTWERRSRFDYDPTYNCPLGEVSELYEVDYYDSSSALLRTVTSITESSTTYTSAQRVSDGASAGEAITCNVFQISGAVGRGYPGFGTV